MNEVSIVGVDLAKQVFQVHGAAADGRVLFRKKLSRPQFAKFMTALPRCIVAMEACGTAHYWGRELARHGHDVRLIPPIYVKPFVKRQKNDAADAEAVAEAALRPTMRSVAVKTAGQQAQASSFAPAICSSDSAPSWSMRSGDISLSMASSWARALAISTVSPRASKKTKTFQTWFATWGGSTSIGSQGSAPKSANWTGALRRQRRKAMSLANFRRCRGSARFVPWQSAPSRPICVNSAERATSRPGSGSFPGNIPAAENRSSAERPRWGNATFAAY